jgi:hypothetical protein
MKPAAAAVKAVIDQTRIVVEKRRAWFSTDAGSCRSAVELSLSVDVLERRLADLDAITGGAV